MTELLDVGRWTSQVEVEVAEPNTALKAQSQISHHKMPLWVNLKRASKHNSPCLKSLLYRPYPITLTRVPIFIVPLDWPVTPCVSPLPGLGA